MDRKETMEIPFGAKDSELKGWEYTIPEGMEAVIKNGMIIVREKESDDERIRKDIITTLSIGVSCEESALHPGAHTTLKEAISWLEKQVEQNPKSADFILTDCTSDVKYENRWRKVEDSLPDNAREVLCKDAIGNFFIGRYYNDGDYWEVSMYDEPDKSNKDNPPVIMWANIPSCEQNLANSAKTCKVEPKVIIPKFRVGDIIRLKVSDAEYKITEISDGYYRGEGWCLDIVAADESDEYELVKQNPAWSEEDDEMFDAIIADIQFTQKAHAHEVNQVVYEREIDWLKSLKERYTWKPSEEQMELLREVQQALLGKDCHNRFVNFMYELKKLKG